MNDVKKIAKELCEKSPCHHKCKDTKDCVVEDEAKELFKQALVEGLNRHIDKTIEEAKKIEQIEEMAKIVLQEPHIGGLYGFDERIASRLYNAGYRKQSEGEWIDKPTGAYGRMQSWCSACGKHSGIGGIESNRHKPFCPNCGAKMKGGN